MAKKNYNFVIKDEKKIAKAYSTNVPVSLKYATEVARELKGKRVSKAEQFLQNVIDQKQHLPLRRYLRKVGHKPGQAQSFTKTGRYPKNCCKAFLSLINSVKSNADYKGLDTESLMIQHIFASQGFRRVGHQTQGRIAGKRHRKKATHLEMIVREAK